MPQFNYPSTKRIKARGENVLIIQGRSSSSFCAKRSVKSKSIKIKGEEGWVDVRPSRQENSNSNFKKINAS